MKHWEWVMGFEQSARAVESQADMIFSEHAALLARAEAFQAKMRKRSDER